MKQHESDLQQNLIKIFRFKYPKLSRRLWAVPNGGWRNEATAVRLKREGVLPGVSDLVLSKPNKKYAGMFIEVKTKTGRLSDNQKDFIEEHKADYYCCVVRSVDEFLTEIENYLTT